VSRQRSLRCLPPIITNYRRFRIRSVYNQREFDRINDVDYIKVEGSNGVTRYERQERVERRVTPKQPGQHVQINAQHEVAPPPEVSSYGSKNKIFTESAANAARELLRKKRDQVSTGLDPELSQAGIQLAGYHIEAGASSLTDYTKAMASDLGAMIKPYIRRWTKRCGIILGLTPRGFKLRQK